MNRQLRVPAVCALLVTAVALTGCRGIKYHSDYPTGADFSQYRTFAWNPIGNNVTHDPRFRGDLIEARIVRSTEKALRTKGLTLAESAMQADVLLTFHLAIDSRITATQVETHYGYDFYWGAWAYGTTYQAFYDQGTIVLDMMENRPGLEDPLVYRGYATGGIEEKPREPEEMDRRMDDIMERILRDYPR